jgi:hypothetical protein
MESNVPAVGGVFNEGRFAASSGHAAEDEIEQEIAEEAEKSPAPREEFQPPKGEEIHRFRRVAGFQHCPSMNLRFA